MDRTSHTEESVGFQVGDLIIYYDGDYKERGVVIAFTPASIMVRWDDGDKQIYDLSTIEDCVGDCWEYHRVKK